MQQIELSLLDPKSQTRALALGSLAICRIINKSKKGYRLQFSAGLLGTADVTEISDEWLADPIDKHSLHSFTQARLIEKTGKDAFNVSLRETFIDPVLWLRALSPETGTTLNY